MADIHEIATGLDTAIPKFEAGNEAVATAEERRVQAAEALAKVMSGIDELFAIRAGSVVGRVGTGIARAHLGHREGVAATWAVAYDSEHPAARQAIASGNAALDSLLGQSTSPGAPHGNGNLRDLDHFVDQLSVDLHQARWHAEQAIESLAALEPGLQTAAAQGALALSSAQEYRASIGAE